MSELESGSDRKRTVEDDYKKTLQDYENLKRAYNLLLNDKDDNVPIVPTLPSIRRSPWPAHRSQPRLLQ